VLLVDENASGLKVARGRLQRCQSWPPPAIRHVPTWQRPSRGAQRRRWEEQSHPQPRPARPVAREHGEAGEHRTFSEASTVAHSSPVGSPTPGFYAADRPVRVKVVAA
jgi:hypothetical protein